MSGPAARPCPVCGSRQARPLVTIPLALPAGHPLGASLPVASCGECGAGFTDAAVSQQSYDDHYANGAKYADDGETNAGSPDTPWNVARLQRTADRLLTWVGPDARLVDIGCATGSLLVALAERGMAKVVGLDPSPRCARVAAGRGATVVTGTLSALPNELGHADIVTMNGVFEHLWEPLAAARAVSSVLAPGGLLYVEVPDAARYCHPYVAPYQDFNTEHVNHFSPATLDRLLRQAGFEPLWQGAADAELGPGFLAATAAGVWRLAGVAPSEPSTLERDQNLVDELVEFTSRSARDLAAVDDALERRLGAAREFAMWGIGEVAYKLLAMPALARRKAVALIDGNPSRHGQRIRGVEVSGPDALAGVEAPVVVASLLAEVSIRADLESRGAANQVVGLPR